MNQRNLLNYLTLDSFGVNIPFSQSKAEMINLFAEKAIAFEATSDVQICISSKILSLDMDFWVDFQFKKQEMIGITISPKDRLSDDDALYQRYGKIQKALERELGKPCNISRYIMNVLDPKSRLSRWKQSGVNIEHYILDRFGMEELISITLTKVS